MKTQSSAQSVPGASTTPVVPVVTKPIVIPWWAGPLRDADLRLGLLGVGLAMAAYLGYDLWRDISGKTSADMAAFIGHYAVAVGFSVWLWVSSWRWKKSEQPSPAWAVRRLALVMWLMSAFALNRTMAVFQVATDWLAGVVVLTCVLLVGAAWLGKPQIISILPEDDSVPVTKAVPVRVQQFWMLGLGIVGLVFVYMAAYLAPLYLISIPGLLLLGISVHSFVPVLIVFYVGRWLWDGWRQHEHLRVAIGLGLAVPVLVLGGFLWQWQRVDNQARYAQNAAQTRRDDELPAWTLLAQHLAPDWVTNKWLHTGVVYDRFEGMDALRFTPNFNDSPRLHDPLVVIASVLLPPTDLPETDRAKLVSTLFDARHQTTEHLWDGRDLRVTNILTQSRLWPEYRLAYTEKTMTIQNRSSSRFDTEEAVFTVHLPEGAVVSSLSLWVNGVEQKGVLTTQAKADTAYRQIVGVESRITAHDPSVVRWMEGNRVAVRVFPCTPDANRQVKIGITAPLRAEGDELVYENPYFEGPDARAATETVQLDFSQTPTFTQRPDFLKPSFWQTSDDRRLRVETHYQPDWSLRVKAPALATVGFVIGGNAYALAPANAELDPFSPTDIYLDLNAGWSPGEVQAVQRMAGKRPVWVYDEGLVRLTAGNQVAVTKRLLTERFSLFPIFRIKDPARALLVTKTGSTGPYLDDLAGSPFGEHLTQYATKPGGQPPVRTWCLSAPAPMLASLMELRVLQPAYGSLTGLEQLLTEQKFARPDAPGHVTLPATGVQLVQTPVPKNAPKPINDAPDHLYRLFAYNHLMQQVGSYYFDRNHLTDKLIHEAQAANIVTPVSGLIVLETQKDYDRFGIKRDLTGLANATLKSEGAVPEPHEWAMIALLLVLLIGLNIRQRYVRA